MSNEIFNKKEIKGLIKIIDKIRGEMQAQIPFLESEINLIITEKDKSHNKIGRLLDTLLDYAYMGVGEEQFKRLNSYVKTFDINLFLDYERYYKEIFEEE